jgi:hypothetical protein
VSPGEGATVTVKLREIAGKGFDAYPGVIFTSDLATIGDQGSAWFYAILACQVDDASVKITVPDTVAIGTVVHVKAQVSMVNAACPDASSITITIPIQ